jgi:hypothetical protein
VDTHPLKGEEMIASTFLSRLGICASLIAALGLTVFPGNAVAGATPVTVTETKTFVGPDVDQCTGATGTNTNTVTDVFHVIGGLPTTHVQLTETQAYRGDWSDGTYLISHSVSHNEFNTGPNGEGEFTFAQQDRGTLYSTDGRVIGYQTVFTQGHITWNNGTVITSPEQFRVTCS